MAAQQGCPFGGTPGSLLNLRPSTSPPARGYRIIPGAVWWRLVFWQWRLYMVLRSAATPNIIPPFLAPLSQTPQVYFTDLDSLQGLISATDFAQRAGLSLTAQTECQRFGCAIIEFDAPPTAI